MGEKFVVVRLGSHGFAFWPGLQSQTTLASALAGSRTKAIRARVTAASGLRESSGGSYATEVSAPAGAGSRRTSGTARSAATAATERPEASQSAV